MDSITILGRQVERPIQSLVAYEDWAPVVQRWQEEVGNLNVSAKSKAAHYASLGKAWVKSGNEQAAIAAYTESLKLLPSNGQYHYALGTLYSRQQKFARAICHYQRALQTKPDWPQAAFRLGSLFHRLGFSSQAYEHYQHLLTIAPDYTDAHLAIGLIHEQRNEPHLALKYYRQAAYLEPRKANARRSVGRVLVTVKAYDAAIDVFNHALRELPKDSQTYISLGQALIAKGDKQGAIEAYQKAISLDHMLTMAHRNLGRVRYSYKDFEGAIGDFRQALQQSPNDLELLSDYATVLHAKGDWPELIESFRLAVRHQPEWIAHYCKRTLPLSSEDLLFRVQRTCGRFLVALQQASSDEADIILQEQVGQIYEYLGDLSLACDAPKQAERFYGIALSIRPYALNLYVALGDCLSVQGRQAAALSIYQAGLFQSNQHQSNQQRKQSHADKWLKDSLSMTTTTATWRLQLNQRFQSVLSQRAVPPSSNNSNCMGSSLIQGIYPTAKDWLKKQPFKEQRGEEQGLSETHARKGEKNSAVSKVNTSGECGGVTCHRCMSRLIQTFSPVQVGKKSFHCSTISSKVSELPAFTITIPNGSAWISPQKNTWDVCNEIAVFAPDGFLIGDLSRSYPWYLPGCTQHKLEDHTLFKRQTPLPKVHQLSGTVALLSGLSGHIYYHWMFDVLPRVAILQKSLLEQGKTLEDIDVFVVNNFEKDFQKETLVALGIPLEKVIASDSVPHILAQQLVVPSFSGHLDWVPPSTLTFLRNIFLNDSSLKSTPTEESYRVEAHQPANFSEKSQKPRIKSKCPKRRLYIMREKARYRHVFNEVAVVETLAQYGFVPVALETLSVAEQAELFSQAEAIVAPHGSGLTNLVFCNPETIVIELFSKNYMRTDYWMISEYLQLSHYYLLGESLECRPLRQLMYISGLTEDFSIDIGELRSLLRTTGLVT